MTKCTYYDCGWCYAPKNVKSNNTNGACYQPQECPQMMNTPQKPAPPPPRLIREEFLPEQYQLKYRIKKVNRNGESYFYVQKMGFFRWKNFDPLGYCSFRTYEDANKYLYYHIMQENENSVEYLPPDFSNFSKNHNPSPKNQ